MAEKKTETKKRAPRKKAEPKEVKAPESTPLIVNYIYRQGDNIGEIAEAITGHAYLAGVLLYNNGKTMNNLKDGDILTWSY